MEIDHEELLQNFLHEVGTLNTIIKGSAEILSKVTKSKIDTKSVAHHSNIILENSFILSTQFDIVNYQLNPDLITIEKADKRNLFGKFYKTILSFKRIAKQKNVNLVLNGEAKTLIDCYPVIDTLPILIVDNALKYTLKDCDITIDFEEDDNSISVSCENVGPKLYPEELDTIFDRGIRGEEAIKTEKPGYGFGLNFVKHICNIHNASCDILVSDREFQVDGVKYSDFKILMDFPKK